MLHVPIFVVAAWLVEEGQLIRQLSAYQYNEQDDFDPNVAKKQLAISKDISIPSNCDQNKVTEVL